MIADAAGTLWLGSGGRSERLCPREEAMMGKLRTEAAAATPRMHRNQSRTAAAGRFAAKMRRGCSKPCRPRNETCGSCMAAVML